MEQLASEPLDRFVCEPHLAAGVARSGGTVARHEVAREEPLPLLVIPLAIQAQGLRAQPTVET